MVTNRSIYAGWQIVFKLTFNTFESLFGDVLKNLERSKQLLLTLADVSHFQEVQHHFLETQQHRLKTQEEYKRDKEVEEKDKTFTVLDWLSPLSQLNQHNRIKQDREEFPLATQWLLNDPSWRDWIHEEGGDLAIFWVSGIPGSGGCDQFYQIL